MGEPKHHIKSVIDLMNELTASQQSFVLGYLRNLLEDDV